MKSSLLNIFGLTMAIAFFSPTLSESKPLSSSISQPPSSSRSTSSGPTGRACSSDGDCVSGKCQCQSAYNPNHPNNYKKVCCPSQKGETCGNDDDCGAGLECWPDAYGNYTCKSATQDPDLTELIYCDRGNFAATCSRFACPGERTNCQPNYYGPNSTPVCCVDIITNDSGNWVCGTDLPARIPRSCN